MNDTLASLIHFALMWCIAAIGGVVVLMLITPRNDP